MDGGAIRRNCERIRQLVGRGVGVIAGYGATYRSRERERWATVGIGYCDGLPRALGNRGWGIAAGRRVPLVGRISMDTAVVRASGSLFQYGDEPEPEKVRGVRPEPGAGGS